MNVAHNDLVELFTFFANMKGDIDLYKDTHVVSQEKGEISGANWLLFLALLLALAFVSWPSLTKENNSLG